MKILVTGAAGFIGSHLIEELKKADHRLILFDGCVSPSGFGSVVVGDFCEYEVVHGICIAMKPDIICHLGAIPSIKRSIDNPLVTLENNIKGTWNILEAARRTRVERVVFASSGAVYGETAFKFSGKALREDMKSEPLNPYGLSKKFGEEMMSMWADKQIWKGVDTVSLRFSNVFGPRQPRGAAYASCIERFMYQWRSGEPFTVVPDGLQRRDMVFVTDVVRAIRFAAERPGSFGGLAINIGSGQNYSILEIADLIGGKDHSRVMIEPRVGEIRETLFDISLAKAALNWQPEISFEEGIEILKR